MCLKKSCLQVFFVLALGLSSINIAYAETLSLRCSVSSSRSTITLVGSGFSKNYYYAIVYNKVTAYKNKLPNKLPNASGVFTYNFDSNITAINAGATTIPYTYNRGQIIYAYLRRASDSLFMGAVKAACGSV